MGQTPIVTLEGALELLMIIKSDLKGCMIKIAAKELVDVEAATPEMRARLECNANDSARDGLRQSCENRDASGGGRVLVGGGSTDAMRVDASPYEEYIRVVKQRSMLEGEFHESFERRMKRIDSVVGMYGADSESQRVVLQLREQARNAGMLHVTTLLNIGAADRALLASPIINGGVVQAAIAAPPSVAALPQTSNDFEPVTISVIMHEMKAKDDANNTKAKAVGKRVAAAYRDKYNKEPDEHGQMVNGMYIKVKSYTRKDVDLIRQAVREICGVE